MSARRNKSARHRSALKAKKSRERLRKTGRLSKRKAGGRLVKRNPART